MPGVNENTLAAASLAYQWSYAHGLRIMILASLSFGLVGFALCFCCEDVSSKVTPDINIYLENDVNAEKNEFH